MNRIFFLLLVLQSLLVNNLLSQDDFDTYLMVTANKLSVRTEPNIDSEKLGFLKKEELVKIIDRRTEDKYTASIDGIVDSWAKVEFNGMIGFVFGGYLAGEQVSMPNDKWKGKFLSMMEGNQAGATYSNTLAWYGIYSRDDGEYIEKVEVKLNYSEESEMEDYLKVSTDKIEESKLLIGTNENIKLGRVGVPVELYTHQMVLSGQRLPLPVYVEDCTVKIDFYLYGRSLNEIENGCNVENYSLEFFYKKSHWTHSTKYENLVEKLGECNIPKIYWYGDLNGDDIPDFIFYNQAMYYAKYKFYMSRKIEDKIDFEKVLDFIPLFTPC